MQFVSSFHLQLPQLGRPIEGEVGRHFSQGCTERMDAIAKDVYPTDCQGSVRTWRQTAISSYDTVQPTYRSLIG